ncbi:phospholipase A1 VesT1.02-like [Topomyia yanbarensis]|uniref:phospholipase A1 VesT1.02-like n=1 Tax=Topomyia yanbarensis TaxID=2498891 RepID=UPI00273C2AC2|nr:phospholipase A1 VesT1.02-like [Topomyia yanbarensis]
MTRPVGPSRTSANLRHRSRIFFIASIITHVPRQAVAAVLLASVLGMLLAGTGDAYALSGYDTSSRKVSLVKAIKGDTINFKLKYDAKPHKVKSHKPDGYKKYRQEGLLEYFPSGALDQDELLANRLGIVVGAFGNTLSQIFFGTDEVRSEVTFWCSNPDHLGYMQVFVEDPNVHQKVDITKPILFLTHGWTDNVNRTWVKEIVGEYIHNFGGNICAVDWSQLALVEYNLAAKNTGKVGRYLAKFVKFLLAEGLTIEQVTLVGHSMGAHISGIAGAALDGKIPMIVGLDPAGPSFTKPFLVRAQKRLDKSDALFVQAIHTDKNIIGTSTNVGHQDFYTNNGASPQPGCEFPLVNNDTTKAYLQFICSHFKAVEYFRASLNRQNIFQGTNCTSYYFYRRGECANNTRAEFGLYNSKGALGPLFISIDKTVYPYAKSIARNK